MPAEVRAQAAKNGYGNAFESIRAYVPWRVTLFSETGAPLYPAPRPGGPLTATEVGPAGETSASGAGEVHTDRLGRTQATKTDVPNALSILIRHDPPQRNKAPQW